MPELGDGRGDELHGESHQAVLGALLVKLLWSLWEDGTGRGRMRRPGDAELTEFSLRERRRRKTDLSCSEYVQTRVAVDAFAPAEVVVVAAVHRPDPDDSIHLFGKLPPLRDAAYGKSFKCKYWTQKQGEVRENDELTEESK